MVGGLDNKWDADSERTQLNEMGQQGWELVAVVVKPHDGKPCTFYYFRKEIQDGSTSGPENTQIPRENSEK